jgi:23S rRNA (guanosine2251-2'-O)-methyltransferase
LLLSADGPEHLGEAGYRSLLSRLGDTALLLFLDHVTDPQNLGAILRSADQFAVDVVVVPARRAAGLSDAVARASSGASAHVRVAVVPNLARCVEHAKSAGCWIYAADLRGTAAHRIDLGGRVGLIVGAEGGGVGSRMSELADASVCIPTRGHVDSLNVSVAVGILLYEVRRQGGW